MNKPKIRTTVLAIATSFSLGIPSILAQSSTQSSPTTDPKAPSVSVEQDTIALSPFTVSTDKDTGYQANDTIVGGRLKTNLQATPSDVAVLTRDLLDDLGASSLVDAGNWLTGSARVFPNDAGGVDFGAQTSFRGLGSGTDTRNGFRVDTTVEGYAVERMEGARGSNAILFGDAPSGGQTNFTTKMARFQNRSEVLLTLDTFGTSSINFDINRILTKKVAARVYTQTKEGHTFWDRSFDKRYGLGSALAYRPWKGAELRFDAEYDYNKTSFQPRFLDQSSKWDGITSVTAPLTSNLAAATGVSRFTTDKLIWLPSQGHLYNFNSFAQVSGSGMYLVDSNDVRPLNFPIIGRRSFFLAPEEEAYTIRSWNTSLSFSQNYESGLSFEVAVNRAAVARNLVNFGLTNTRTDVNQVLPRVFGDTTSPYVANPNFGKRYSEGVLNRGSNDQSSDQERATISYEFKKFSWFRQLLGVSAANRIAWYYPITSGYGRTNGTNTDRRNAANQITLWRYWNESNLGASPNYPEVAADGANIKQYYNRHDTTYARIQSFQLSTVGYYLHDTLTMIAGWRREHLRGATTTIGTWDSLGDVSSYSTTQQPNRFTNANSIGLTYFPIKQVGIYANRGGGFQQGGNSSPLLTNGMQLFSHSVTQSAGLRLRLLGGGLIAQMGYYDSMDLGRSVSLTKTNINNIWAAMNHPELQVQSQFSTYADLLDYHGWGTEGEITLNLSKRFRLMGNASFPRTQQASARRLTVDYVNANKQRWENAAKGLDVNGNPLTGTEAITPANQASITSNLPAVYDLVTGAAGGRTLDGTYKYRANFFGVYTLQGTSMKGLEIGGGANFYGKRQIGNQPNLPFAYVYNEASYTATAFLNYPFKIFSRRAKLQLNVSNLFDWNRPVFSTTTVYQPNTSTPLSVFRNAYNYVAPRSLSMTLKYEF